jgi:hypothetical protein
MANNPQALSARPVNRKQSFRKRVELMRNERTSFFPYWQDLSDFCLAHRGRFLITDRDKGYKRNTKQINNTARLAVRTLASGMMAGITSPARPWFKLGMADDTLMEIPDVKMWLMNVERLMREIFNQSNLYNSLHATYQELGVFGTASMGVFEDFENVIRCKPYTVGSYFLALNGKDVVDTWAREYQMTVAQVVDRFGFDQCSVSVQNQWNSGNTEQWVSVTHMVEPNSNRDHMSPLAKDKRFRSVYYEEAKGSKGDKFLLESGFDELPILAPRWEVTGEDIYGVACPGMDALGDTQTLQVSEEMKYQGYEKTVDPHMIAPSTMRNAVTDGLPPGEISFVDPSALEGLRSAYNINFPLQYMNEDIAIVQERINKAFYVDLFMMLSNTDRRQITAREIAERHEEKLLMLGPVLERLHNELLDPLIDRTFNIGLKAGIFGEIPEQLSEKSIKVEYISVLAQAQRLIAVGGIRQVAGYVGEIAAIWPEARHKFKAAKSVDDMAAAIGVSPDLIASDDEYQQAVQAEAEAAQQAQAAASMPQMVDSAKTLSETDMTGDTALNTVMARAGGLGG